MGVVTAGSSSVGRRAGLSDAGHAERDGAAAAHEADGLLDLGAVFGGEVVEVGLDPVDEAADALDLLFGRHGLGSRPVVGLERGHQAFAAAEQVGEVGLEVGEVGDVGGEVLAAQAAEPQGAGVATGGDVGGFAADAVGRGDLADRAADVLGVEQALRGAPDPVAVAVELQGGDAVDGFAASFGVD
ncbi:hypothetical protein ABR737_40855 [Streptomyces sp. Edi2]|uniref:hypothetical protein n=1 Tax=Streptomyces sp. Edi2 TaxID=3162528 RepID=UPI003305AF64